MLWLVRLNGYPRWALIIPSTLSQGFSLLLLLGILLGATPLPPQQLLPALLLVLLAPTLAMLLQAALQRTRERLADRDAARLTGDPRGLASALRRLQQYSQYLRGWLGRFRFLYTSDGRGAGRAGADAASYWLRTHPSTEERVRDLLALEAGMRSQHNPAARVRLRGVSIRSQNSNSNPRIGRNAHWSMRPTAALSSSQ